MKWFFMLFLTFSTVINAQMVETFDDEQSNLSSRWMGNRDKFIINAASKLQLSAPEEASNAFIFATSSVIEDATWQADVEMQFDPSSQNFCRIYLLADQSDPSLVQNAYYINIGANDDEVSLMKVQNGKTSVLIDGTDARLTLKSVKLTVKATFSINTGWQLFTKTSETWNLEGAANDSPALSNGYFGLYCKYTATRSTKFNFDNIDVAGKPLQDRVAPKVTTSEVLTNKLLCLNFSEALRTEAAVIKINSSVTPEIITPIENNQQLRLKLDQPLNDDGENTVTLHGITDNAGNQLQDTTIKLSYHRVRIHHYSITNNQLVIAYTKPMKRDELQPETIIIDPALLTIQNINWMDSLTLQISFDRNLQNKTTYLLQLPTLNDKNGDNPIESNIPITIGNPERFDIVFTELLIDPSPTVGMPDNQFIELYNRSNTDLNLNGYVLKYGLKSYVIPNTSIKSGEYLVLMDEDNVAEWKGNVVAMKSFPALKKTEGELTLLSSDSVVIDAIRYDERWQDESFKTDGGWSFEIIDADNKCGNSSNWIYSISNTGGTPGIENSVKDENKDTQSPFVKCVAYTSNNELTIFFSESINGLDTIGCNSFEVTNRIAPLNIEVDSIYLDRMTVTFDSLAIKDNVYELKFTIPLHDLASNELMPWFPICFGKPAVPEAGSLIINEILFNPAADDVDYIEIYNGSSQTITMNEIYLSNMSNNIPEKLIPLSNRAIPMMPGDYWVITPDTSAVLRNHKCNFPYRVWQTSTFPSMPDDEGNIAIENVNGEVIDQLHYSEKWHYPLFNTPEGVALERINPLSTGQDPKNWFSASSSSGYGTPTSMNSQYQTQAEIADKAITLEPSLFTPDMDGVDDLLRINIGSGYNGSTLLLRIYTPEGEVAKELTNNTLTGNNDYFVWDGTNESGKKLSPGIYIVWGRFFNTTGEVNEIKKACVLGVKAGGGL